MEPEAKKKKLKDLPPCPYGKKCYRKNPIHFKEYIHPDDKDSLESEDEPCARSSGKHKNPVKTDTSKLPPCPFGTRCYRKNLLHFAEFSHPFTDDGASTSKDVPEDSGSDTDVLEDSENAHPSENNAASTSKAALNGSDSDTDVMEADEERGAEKNPTSNMKRDESLTKRYSLMTEEERKELIQKALAAKKKLEEELEKTKKTVAEKENAIKLLQDEMNKGTLFLEGEKEAMEGEEIKFFTLLPERQYKEGSAAQVHFRLAESQFYRLLGAGMGATYKVNKVEYVVNPKLVKRFNAAKEDMAKTRGKEYSHPILAFHGTEEKNIIPIIETGFKIPGVDDKKLKHRMNNTGYYGKGIYFSEFASYSLGYVAGKNTIMLNKVLPGKVYDTPGMIVGSPLHHGFDSHMSPCKKELVIFHTERILPCYIVHYDSTGREFKYKKAVEERRKAEDTAGIMKHYWKAKKAIKSTIFAGHRIDFCGQFADNIPELRALVKKHGGGTCEVVVPAGTGRGRATKRGSTFAPVVDYRIATILITTDKDLSKTFKDNSITMAESNKAVFVREEFLYDSIIARRILDTDDYEFD